MKRKLGAKIATQAAAFSLAGLKVTAPWIPYLINRQGRPSAGDSIDHVLNTQPVGGNETRPNNAYVKVGLGNANNRALLEPSEPGCGGRNEMRRPQLHRPAGFAVISLQ
jgi:hypothetical protein